MVGVTDVPNELSQNTVLHDDEEAGIWNMIFKNRDFLEEQRKQGVKVCLIGADLHWIEKAGSAGHDGLTVALAFLRPRGTSRYKVKRPFPIPVSVEERSLFIQQNEETHKQYWSETEHEDALFRRTLLSLMRPRNDHDFSADLVNFDGVSVHIGRPDDDRRLMRVIGQSGVLILNEGDKTLVLTYGEGMRIAKIAKIGPVQQIDVAEGYQSFRYCDIDVLHQEA